MWYVESIENTNLKILIYSVFLALSISGFVLIYLKMNRDEEYLESRLNLVFCPIIGIYSTLFFAIGLFGLLDLI